jgi:FlgD Ig-like domain
MDVNYGISGNEMRVLVYTLGDGSLATGKHQLLSIPVNGSLTLIKAEAAGYYGNPMTVSIRALPDRFEASQNIPNPFNPITTISLRLPMATEWSLTVYNVAGQVVRGFSGYSEAGTIEVTWDATDEGGQKVASGIYLYKATAGEFSLTRKMILMK